MAKKKPQEQEVQSLQGEVIDKLSLEGRPTFQGSSGKDSIFYQIGKKEVLRLGVRFLTNEGGVGGYPNFGVRIRIVADDGVKIANFRHMVKSQFPNVQFTAASDVHASVAIIGAFPAQGGFKDTAERVLEAMDKNEFVKKMVDVVFNAFGADCWDFSKEEMTELFGKEVKSQVDQLFHTAPAPKNASSAMVFQFGNAKSKFNNGFAVAENDSAACGGHDGSEPDPEDIHAMCGLGAGDAPSEGS